MKKKQGNMIIPKSNNPKVTDTKNREVNEISVK
jgi:hypothetical protein